MGTFPDNNSTLMLVCTRLCHVVGIQWGDKKYMSMKHFEAALEDTSIDLFLKTHEAILKISGQPQFFSEFFVVLLSADHAHFLPPDAVLLCFCTRGLLFFPVFTGAVHRYLEKTQCVYLDPVQQNHHASFALAWGRPW